MKSSSIQRLDLYKSNLNKCKKGFFFLRVIWMLIIHPIFSSCLPGTFWRKLLLRLFGSKIGVGGRIKPRVRISFPWNIEIGDYCWIGEDVWIDCLSKVIIGNRVCISQGVYICTGNHNYKSPLFDLILKPISIGDESWVAAKSILAPGTSIGRKSVISMGSVVSGEVPEGVIVKGNPGKVLKRR